MSVKNKIKLNGGEFLIKESLSNEIFTPEDFFSGTIDDERYNN